jgi:NADH dehydrogenase/NADH:ubiquinone oxidoreductase subunit G
MSQAQQTGPVTLTIDGKTIETQAGTTLLAAAKDANIWIPNLCSNEELAPYAACRLCMVEVTQGKRTRLVASCIYGAAEGLVVKTDTARVQNVRRLVMELLLTRNPRHPRLLELAERLGVNGTRFEIDVRGCILCGQCIRTCREVVGVSAIGYYNRGVERKVSTPFGEAPPDCIACGSCAYICPVDVIPMKEENGVRTIWNTDFPLETCESCGAYIAPKKQLDYFRKIADLPEDRLRRCKSCME